MAKYGARYSQWAAWKDDETDSDPSKMPKYGTAKTMGELNKVGDNPNFNEGSLAGDDQIVLYEKKFKDGTVDVESVYMPLADAAEMLGASVDSTENATGLAHGDDDVPPYIGYGFITHHVSKTKSYFEVIFYPKLKASPTSETYDTRGDNINFVTDKVSFHWESPACRKYQVKKDFETEEAARTYLDGLFTGTSAVPGMTATGA